LTNIIVLDDYQDVVRKLDCARLLEPFQLKVFTNNVKGLGQLSVRLRDADVLADLRALQVIRGVPRLPDVRAKGQDAGRRHGDAAIALALAFYASRELNKGPVRVHTRGVRASAGLLKGY